MLLFCECCQTNQSLIKLDTSISQFKHCVTEFQMSESLKCNWFIKH